jgi:hypothetical protein
MEMDVCDIILYSSPPLVYPVYYSIIFLLSPLSLSLLNLWGDGYVRYLLKTQDSPPAIPPPHILPTSSSLSVLLL